MGNRGSAAAPKKAALSSVHPELRGLVAIRGAVADLQRYVAMFRTKAQPAAGELRWLAQRRFQEPEFGSRYAGVIRKAINREMSLQIRYGSDRVIDELSAALKSLPQLAEAERKARANELEMGNPTEKAANQLRMEAFLQGMHAKLGQQSSLQIFNTNPIADFNVLPHVFAFAGTQTAEEQKAAWGRHHG